MIFGMTISSDIVHMETVSFQLCVNQNRSSDQTKKQAFYQKLVTNDGTYQKSESNSATYNIDCVMSNRLQLGVEVGRRSVSPGTNTLSAPNSLPRSSSLSPSQSLISLMSSNQKKSKGSNSSLHSTDGVSTPKKGSNVIDKLNKTFGSFRTAKPKTKNVPIDKIVSTLHQHKSSNQTIEDKE